LNSRRELIHTLAPPAPQSLVRWSSNGLIKGKKKDKATWYRMTRELAAVIQRVMGGAEAIVVIENEFNKGGVENYEAFDGYLLDQIVELHRVAGLRTIAAR